MATKPKAPAPIVVGSRNVSYKTRWASGTGRVTDIYDTRTGKWYVLADSKTGATVKARGEQVFR